MVVTNKVIKKIDTNNIQDNNEAEDDADFEANKIDNSLYEESIEMIDFSNLFSDSLNEDTHKSSNAKKDHFDTEIASDEGFDNVDESLLREETHNRMVSSEQHEVREEAETIDNQDMDQHDSSQLNITYEEGKIDGVKQEEIVVASDEGFDNVDESLLREEMNNRMVSSEQHEVTEEAETIDNQDMDQHDSSQRTFADVETIRNKIGRAHV